MTEDTRRQRAREAAGKIADFAQAWYAGKPDGKDDFRFVAHAIGDIESALRQIEDETREACAKVVESTLQRWHQGIGNLATLPAAIRQRRTP